jgi:uncharacterized protein YecT (DUF1311 family)
MSNFALILALLAAPAGAEPDCTSPVTSEINECARIRFEAADKALNVEYQQVLESLARSTVDPTQTQYKDARRMLIHAQRAWVVFRKKDCDAVFEYWRDGTIRTSMYFECMTNRTEQRTREIASFIEAY